MNSIGSFANIEHAPTITGESNNPIVNTDPSLSLIPLIRNCPLKTIKMSLGISVGEIMGSPILVVENSNLFSISLKTFKSNPKKLDSFLSGSLFLSILKLFAKY